jgi:hypothetical protein
VTSSTIVNCWLIHCKSCLSILNPVVDEKAVTFYMQSKKNAGWDWGFYAEDKNGFNKEAIFI